VPNVEGTQLKNVFTLRNYTNNKEIHNTANKAKNIIIIGANFIGMEMASNLKKLNPHANITVIDRNITPFEQVLGKDIGTALRK
jgi:NADPH-dependent 2,4-dienoyl-CoA reductase/sulfur reductase-like enzyme